MTYMVWTSSDGEYDTYETEKEAMDAANDYINTELDEISPDEDIIVYKAIAQLEVTEIDAKARAITEGREWDYPYDNIVQLKMVKLDD